MRRILLGALLLATACAAVTPAAAVVNGQKISEGEIQTEMDSVRDDPNFRELIRRQGDEFRGQARRNVLLSYIRVQLYDQAAHRRHIGVRESEITKYLDDLKRRVGGVAEYRKLLRDRYLTQQRARKLARRLILEDKLTNAVTKDLKVDDARIQQFYEQNRTAFTEVHLQRVTAPNADAAKQAAADPKAAWKDMGYAEMATLDSGLVAQIEPVPVGGLTAPVQDATGFSIFKVLDRRPKPLDQVRPKITEQVLGAERKSAFTTWLQAQMRDARIIVNPKYGRFDRASLTVVAAPTKLPE
jgi:parvulin-like peptidyl-prolyl isomerase